MATASNKDETPKDAQSKEETEKRDVADNPEPANLLTAIKKDDQRLFHNLIKAGADINMVFESDFYKRTPLIYAIHHEKKTFVDALISAGADVDKRCRYIAATPLIYAVEREDESIFRALLNAGAGLNLTVFTQDLNGCTALHYAIQRQRRNLVRALIDGGADVNITDNEGKTALTYALLEDMEDQIPIIIDAGADVNIQDIYGRTTLSGAVLNNMDNEVQTLIDAGADVNKSGGDENGNTILFCACQYNVKDAICDGRNCLFEKDDKENSFFCSKLCDTDGKLVRTLIDAGADVNITDNEGKTALFCAVKNDNENVIRALIAAGADVNITDNYGRTALFYSALSAKEEAALALFKAGADVNVAVNESGSTDFLICTALEQRFLFGSMGGWQREEIADAHEIDNFEKISLLYAVLCNKKKISCALTDAGFDAEYRGAQDSCNSRQQNLLDVLFSNESVARILIEAGADINIVDNDGKTALFFAALRDKKNIVCALIEAGADVNVSNNDGETALFYAAKGHSEGAVRSLIVASTDVDITTASDDEYVALLKKAHDLCDDESVVRALIDAGADVNITDNEKKTALYYAVICNREKVVRALIKAGADVNVINIEGRNVLFHASLRFTNESRTKDYAEEDVFLKLTESIEHHMSEFLLHASLDLLDGSESVVRALIDAGADVNRTDNDGQTALFGAACHGQESIVRSLINAGTGVNITDKRGWTAIFLALSDESVVRALVDAGADVNAVDVDGFTAMSLAAFCGNENVVRALIDAGVTVNAIDKQGQTALFHAVLGNKKHLSHQLKKAKGNVNKHADFDEKETIVRTLVDAGADVDVSDNNKKTALFYAVQDSNERVVRVLIDAGADVNMSDNHGRTALFFNTAVQDRERRVNRLMNKALGAIANMADDEGIYFALPTIKDDCDDNTCIIMARMLIENGGALVNVRDHYGRTSLFYAVKQSLSLAKYLLKQGADPNQKDHNHASVPSIFIESCMRKERIHDPPLAYFEDADHMSEGLDILASFGVERKTIYEAVINAVFCRILYLVSSSRHMTDFWYLSSVIDLASSFCNERQNNRVESKRLETFETIIAALPSFLALLIESCADPNATDMYGNTVAHYATRLPFVNISLDNMMMICHLLKEFGVNFDAKNYQNETPLIFSLSDDFPESVKGPHLHLGCLTKCYDTLVQVWRFYLDHGSSVNGITESGNSVYHLLLSPFLKRDFKVTPACILSIPSVLCKTGELMTLLPPRILNLKFTVNHRDAELNSPLHLWALCRHKYNENMGEGYVEIFNHLLNNGAQLNSRNGNEETPLHLCKSWAAVELLVTAGAQPDVLDSVGRSPLLFAATENEPLLEHTDRFYPDVTQEPKDFFRKVTEMNLDPWTVDKSGNSVWSILIALEKFVLANALVEVARDENVLHKDNISSSLLNAICKDSSLRAHWKASLVETILMARKSPIDGNLFGESPLHLCCRNIIKISKSATDDEIKSSVHWTILKILLSHGFKSIVIPDQSGKSCLDVAEEYTPLKELLLKPIDIKDIPLLVPWTSISNRYRGILSKVARQLEYQHTGSFWYHKDRLTSGSFGLVFAGINNKDGREVAIKRIEKLRLQRPEDKREIENLTILADCQQVVRYLSFFEEKDFSYIVLELMEGNLDECLDSAVAVKERLDLCKDVLLGLKFLHDVDILHRDLKPTNILYKLQPKPCLKIADFGLSRRADSISTTVCGTNVGTRCWIAPEVLKATKDYSKASDVFACGLVFHYVLSMKKHPFSPAVCSGKSESQVINETEANVMKDNMEGWDNSLSLEATHLLKKMLDCDDSRRPCSAEALDHPLFWSNKKKVDLLIAVANQPELNCPRFKVTSPTAVENDLEASFGTIVKYGVWNDPGYVHMPAIYAETTKGRRTPYDPLSTVELVRFIRNAYAHVSEGTRSKSVRKHLLEDFVFLEYFPNLVMEVFKAVTTHGWDQTREEIKYAMSE